MASFAHPLAIEHINLRHALLIAKDYGNNLSENEREEKRGREIEWINVQL
jgi:hypothetical protein